MPGSSSSCVPWSKTPPGASPPRPSYGGTAVAFRLFNAMGTRNGIVFEATHSRPTRSRAYASPSASPRPSQGSLSARAGSPLAERVSHPLDDERSFMESSRPPFLSDQPCLVALKVLSLDHDVSPNCSTVRKRRTIEPGPLQIEPAPQRLRVNLSPWLFRVTLE